MAASRIDEITDYAIRRRLAQVTGATCQWSCSMPADWEEWDVLASAKVATVDVGEVRAMLERHDLVGDDATQEIDMAIAIFAEPMDLPEGATVSLYIGND